MSSGVVIGVYTGMQAGTRVAKPPIQALAGRPGVPRAKGQALDLGRNHPEPKTRAFFRSKIARVRHEAIRSRPQVTPAMAPTA